jgi:hypothetical protein
MTTSGATTIYSDSSNAVTLGTTIVAVNDAPTRLLSGVSLSNRNEDGLAGTTASHNAYTGFVSGPTAQSSANRWQYFKGSTSSLNLLTNWRASGIISGFPQWDGNSESDGKYPLVQQVSTSTSINFHPSSTEAVAIGWKNTSSSTVQINFGLTLAPFESQGDGVSYSIQRGLVGTSRYLAIQSGSIAGLNSVSLTSASTVELQAGEFLYLVVDKRGDFYYDLLQVTNFTVSEVVLGLSGDTISNLFNGCRRQFGAVDGWHRGGGQCLNRRPGYLGVFGRWFDELDSH